MRIVRVEWSDEVKGLVEEIFAREGFPEVFRGRTDDYIRHLLIHIAQKLKEDGSGQFREEMRRLAVNAHNLIHYSIQLGSDRHPIDED